MTVETRWSYKISDPMASVLEVGNFEKASQDQIVAGLREFIGGLNVHDVLAHKETIAEQVCARLNEAAAKWGVQATKLEISEITLPREAQEAVQRGPTRQAACPARWARRNLPSIPKAPLSYMAKDGTLPARGRSRRAKKYV
jgi:regulator of protease activity HflC (stomatin/prohibitin superfamily)